MPPVCSVLIADDDDDVRTLLSVSLRKAGFAVTAVGGGSEALAAAQDAGLRVYVLDVGMPDVSGLEVCRALKACKRTAASPVLLISSDSSLEHVEAGYAAGADDYLPKPFRPRELVHRVSVLAARAGEQAVPADGPAAGRGRRRRPRSS